LIADFCLLVSFIIAPHLECRFPRQCCCLALIRHSRQVRK
jgi:hypothetical protein